MSDSAKETTAAEVDWAIINSVIGGIMLKKTTHTFLQSDEIPNSDKAALLMMQGIVSGVIVYAMLEGVNLAQQNPGLAKDFLEAHLAAVEAEGETPDEFLNTTLLEDVVRKSLADEDLRQTAREHIEGGHEDHEHIY